MSEPATRPAHDTSVSPAASPADPAAYLSRLSLVGPGRAGTTLARALRDAGVEVDGPLGRGELPEAPVVLLCVPDGEITAAASALAEGARPRFVGHVSGATPLAALEPARRAGSGVFGLHPLQTLSVDGSVPLAGAGCAIAGSSRAALGLARRLAERLRLVPFEIEDEARASYHAAASIASNFLITLEAAAETVAAGAGFTEVEARALFAPLVRQTVESWSARGPKGALTGPVARGDARTVADQRAAVAAADPALLALFDALVERTEALAGRAPAAAPRTLEAAA